ncbi:MAG: polysaccharide biosynthesis protein, partial [Cyanobacteria bacterium P01_A01_bin.17]
MLNGLSDAFLKLRNRHFFLIDAVCFSLTPLLALNLRLDGVGLPERFQAGLIAITLLFIFLKFLVYLPFGLYRSFWRYASIDELLKIVSLTFAVIILQAFAFSTLQSLGLITLPRSLPFIEGLLTLLFVGGSRFSLRAIERFNHRWGNLSQWRTSQAHALIIGAGDAGVALARELESNSG